MTIRIDIESRGPAPARDGAPAYEILRGRFHGELDPQAAHNASWLLPEDAEKLVRQAQGSAVLKDADAPA